MEGCFTVHSFLLIGQSNMAGRGFLEEARPINNDRIYTLRNGRWIKMFRPINPDRAFSGVSLAESFAERYVQEYDTDVGLICCADGGTRLDQWAPGSQLFDNAVYQAKLAQRTSTIVGILWHQGESDCTEELSRSYRQRFEAMLSALREALDLPDVPVLIGGLGDYLQNSAYDGIRIYHPAVNKVLQQIAEEDPKIAFVSAEGLTGNPDDLHFNSASLYEFGLRYFSAYQNLAPANRYLHQEAVDSGLERSQIELL